MERGILYAFISLVLWGIIGVLYRVAGVELGADPLLFACMELFFGACSLLMLAGVGREGLETLKLPQTWAMGLSRVMNATLYMMAVLTLTATDVYFILRLYVLTGLVFAWFLFNRKPSRHDAIGSAILLLGMVLLFAFLEFPFWHWAVLCVLGMVLLETTMAILGETHPVSNKTVGVRGRCRFTGIVLLVTSLFFIGLLGIFSLLGGEILNYTPRFETVLKPEVLLMAIGVGAILRAPTMYFYLYATRLAKTENFLMAAAVGPFIVLGIESLFSFLNVLPMREFSTMSIIAGLLITFGGLWMVVMRLLKHNKENQRDVRGGGV